MSYSSVREALVASVACTRPPVRRQMQEGVDGAEGEMARFRQRPRALHVVEQPGDLGGGEIGIEQQAGLPASPSASWPALSGARQASAVRRSCQTMARWIGLPVRRSQTTDVSRWLVMPMAAMPAAVSPAAAMRLTGGLDRGAPDVLGVVLHPPRLRVVLRELALAQAADGQIGPEDDGAAGCRALVQGED